MVLIIPTIAKKSRLSNTIDIFGVILNKNTPLYTFKMDIVHHSDAFPFQNVHTPLSHILHKNRIIRPSVLQVFLHIDIVRQDRLHIVWEI